jgi:uncharacterized protein YeaO (DUF488 family)
MPSAISKIHIQDGSNSILAEIELLKSTKKKIEKDFERLRSKLLNRKKVSKINSSNWEDWKKLSMEYDEIRQIMKDINEKILTLKKFQEKLPRKHIKTIRKPKIIKIKRVYEKYKKDDGFRILIDRLWPRGLSKKKSKVDLWLKDIAPSNELRKWFSHDPKKWADFKMKYKKELKCKLDLLRKVEQIEEEKGIVTLLYSAKDKEHNNAMVLKEILKNRK